MSILDAVVNPSFADIKKAMDDSFNAMADMLYLPSFPEPFKTDMTMSYSTVHYVKNGQYVDSRQIPLSLGEANEAQQHKPDCVMWRLTSGGWVWWYHDGTINHWRLAHDEVQPVPEILKMMKLMGAL